MKLMDMTVGEVAELVGGRVVGGADARITGVNGIKEAQEGDLSFIRTSRYLPFLATTKASAVLIASEPEACAIPLIIVPYPDLSFAQVLQLCEQSQMRHPQGIHETAVIGENVQLGKGVCIDAHVRIADDCIIGDRAVLYAGVYVGHGSVVGEETVIYPNVVLREHTEVGRHCILHAGAVLGSDGFGFAPIGGQWAKIPQVGRVILGDDVEVGANTAIDRATFGVTRVKRGTKIDNLVQIGHNVEVGEHSAIAGKAGIAGSVIIGNHVRIGAAAGLAGHIDIGDGAAVGAQAGVAKSVEPGKTVLGSPAMDLHLFRRVWAAQKRLPQLLRRVRQLERQIEALEKHLHGQAENDS